MDGMLNLRFTIRLHDPATGCQICLRLRMSIPAVKGGAYDRHSLP
jgi:hypothetical protein